VSDVKPNDVQKSYAKKPKNRNHGPSARLPKKLGARLKAIPFAAKKQCCFRIIERKFRIPEFEP